MARTIHLRNQLQNLKKGTLNINEYVVMMKGIADSLIVAGQVVSDQDLVGYILGGVGQEYDPVVVTITAKEDALHFRRLNFF